MPDFENGDIFEERFQIIKKLGIGGFAGSYLALDLQTQEKVVLKMPDVSQLGDPAVYERFKRELSIGKLLVHPDLPVAISFSDGTPPYLVLKYFEGDTLAYLLNKGKSFTVEQSIDMVANLLDALQYCHEKGVFHRDIKPENLVLGTDGHLKIIDFGIAVMEGGPRVTWRGFSGLIGTPEYMSPEQIKGERGGAKSDIYAVGCLLYQLIASEPPFTGDNPMTTMYQHLSQDPKPLTSINNKLNPAIWACVKRAMRRRKEERYSSAADMARDLRNLDKVNLDYINKDDPPMVTISKNKNFGFIIMLLIVILGVGLAFLLYFLNK
ncbi:MAG: serine/threonine-protein kinase [Bacillota bacterium]|nr:serine/threonine-protein kinase [Bacillota bacterium]